MCLCYTVAEVINLPNKLKDLTGIRFGKLVVLHRDENNDNQGKPKWICVCDCGGQKSVRSSVLLRGECKSCNQCKQNEKPLFVRTHKNRLYHAWSEMRRRCNGRCTNHQYYGDKGISYCTEWDDFDVFAAWAIENGYQPGLEIDRIDSDMNYTPNNCRWVSHKKNSRNRKARSNNTTGYPGVQERKLKSGGVSYRVTITTDNGKINLGSYPTIAEAAAVRREAELKYWGFNIGE